MKIIPIGRAEPDQLVIEMCRNLLQLAESGELRSIIYISEMSDGSRSSGWTPSEDPWKLVAEASHLFYKLNWRLARAAEDI